MVIERFLLLTTFATMACAQIPASLAYPRGSATACITAPGFNVEALCAAPGELPLGNFVPPTSGSWTDQNFGGVLRLLTDVRANHSYSTLSPFSAGNKHIAVKLPNGTAIFDRATSKLLYAGRPGNVSGEGIYWDASDDDVYYYISGAKVMKHVLSTAKTTTLVDYAAGTPKMTSITGGGTSDATGDNWLAFFAPTEKQICALDISNVKTYCADYTAANPGNRVGWDFVDFPLMTKSVDSTTGKRYVLLLADPAVGVYSVDFAAGVLRFEHRGPEMRPDAAGVKQRPGNGDGVCDPGEVCLGAPHSDTMSDASGRQFLVLPQDLASPCSRVISRMEISKGLSMVRSTAEGGGRTDLLQLGVCGNAAMEWPAQHIGCAKGAASCVISTYSGTLRDPADLTSPVIRGPFGSEVMIISADGSQLRRLAQTRTVRFTTDSYWSTSRAAISPDAKYVLFDSNFGVPGAHRAVLLDALAQPDIQSGSNGVPAPSTTSPSTGAGTDQPEPDFAPVGAVKFQVSGSPSRNEPVTATAVFRNAGGQSSHYLGYILFLPLPNVVSFNAQGTCLIEFNRMGGNFDGRGGVRLINNSGNGWLGRVVGEPATAGTAALSNAVCTVNVAGVTVTFSGTDMTVTVPVTFHTPANVSATMGTFIQSNSATGVWSDFRQFGNWTVAGAPVRPGPRVVSGTPAAGAGSTAQFSITAGHSRGLDKLGEVHIRFASSIVGSPACHIIYSPAVNVMSMINDAGTALIGPVPLGQPLTSGRCSVPAGAWRNVAGSDVTLNLPVNFHASVFGTGTKNVYVNGFDVAGAVTHWVQTGTWTVQ